MKLKYHFCWNDEQKFYYDKRFTKKYFIYFFFHITRYWEEENILKIFKNKKLQQLFKKQFQFIYNEWYDFYLKNEKVLNVIKVLNQTINKEELWEPFDKKLLKIEEKIKKNEERIEKRLKKQNREKYNEFVFWDKLLLFKEKKKFILVLKCFLWKFPNKKRNY